ncbi:uncharacterized protein [Amphiura filiformis]|uniref:uncharacterized protein n=1 Tax=Amphiura filiformis TaxID=82378 RepID=UPI003B20D726
MEYAAFSSSGNSSTQFGSCTFCGRSFNPESLARHEPICRKSQTKKRRVFNSGKQRADGTGISITKVERPGLQTQTQPAKITNWRQNHLDFVNSIRSARAAQKAIATGAPLPPPPPPSLNPDYIPCPYCNRRFNQSAGARHIPLCGERTKLHGAPVKPLHKRAAADVGYSVTGIRKAYDNKVVRRKSQGNPYAYARTSSSDVPPARMYSSAYGGKGPDVRQDIQPRRPSLPASRNNSAHQASLPNRNRKSANSSNSHSSVLDFRQGSSSSSIPQDKLSHGPIGHLNRSSSFDQNGAIIGQPQKVVGRSSRPVRSAVAGSRPKSNRPKSGVRFADKLERVEGQDPPSPREPHPPPHPPPSYNQVQSQSNGTSPPQPPQPINNQSNAGGSATSWYGNQGTYRTTKASEMRLQRRQMSNPGIRSSPRLSQESGSPRDEETSSFEVTSPLKMGYQRNQSRTSHYGTPPTSPNSPSAKQNQLDRNSPSQNQRTESTQRSTHTSELSNGHMMGSNEQTHPRILASLDKSAGHLAAPFCFSCGTQFPVLDARFCCGCGMQRAFISEAPS